MNTILLIGGIDPTGQAGLARDIAQATKEGVHACPVVSGHTVQATGVFAAANPVSASIVTAQTAAAVHETRPRITKVGALFSKEQVDAVARIVDEHRLLLVLNPVLASSSGTAFLDEEALSSLRTELLPRAHLIVLNEAEGRQLAGDGDAAVTAARLVDLGAGAALVTRGGEAADVLFDGSHHELAVQLQAGAHRGTGCRLSSRIAAMMARGTPRRDAVRAAHRDLQEELAGDAALAALDAGRRAHLAELEAWMPRILAELRFEDIPEVGSNIAYAIAGARDPRQDVCGLAGRITIAGFSRGVAGRLQFGGPHHTGRIAVILQEYDQEARIVMNHRYDPAFLLSARRGGLAAVEFRREDEPADAPSTMEWGFRDAIHRHGAVPDIVWDSGGIGKEAMIRVIAKDPDDLVHKLRTIHLPRLEEKADFLNPVTT